MAPGAGDWAIEIGGRRTSASVRANRGIGGFLAAKTAAPSLIRAQSDFRRLSNLSHTAAAVGLSGAMTRIVSSPAMVPTISGHSSLSRATATELAWPGAV